MKDQALLDRLNSHRPRFLELMGCTITEADAEAQSCTMTFDLSHDYCHSVDIVQGGFVTAMLDAVASHAVFATDPTVVGVSSLEIKVSFLEVTRAGRLTAKARILRAGRSIAFLVGELYNEEGKLTATISTTAKISRPR